MPDCIVGIWNGEIHMLRCQGAQGSYHGLHPVHGQMPAGQMLTNKLRDWTNAHQEKMNKQQNYIILFIYLHSES